MVVVREAEDVRNFTKGRFSLVDSGSLGAPAISGGSPVKNKRTTSGVIPERLPQPFSKLVDSGATSEATEPTVGNDGNMNQPKLVGILLALILGAYYFFK